MEYGHYFYSKYAPKTDTVFAVVLLLVVFSIFGPVAQRSKYQHACSFLVTAAVKGWSLQQGGTKEVGRLVGDFLGGGGEREGSLCCRSAVVWPSSDTIQPSSRGTLKQTLEIRKRALEQVRAKKGAWTIHQSLSCVLCVLCV